MLLVMQPLLLVYTLEGNLLNFRPNKARSSGARNPRVGRGVSPGWEKNKIKVKERGGRGSVTPPHNSEKQKHMAHGPRRAVPVVLPTVFSYCSGTACLCVCRDRVEYEV